VTVGGSPTGTAVLEPPATNHGRLNWLSTAYRAPPTGRRGASSKIRGYASKFPERLAQARHVGPSVVAVRDRKTGYPASRRLARKPRLLRSATACSRSKMVKAGRTWPQLVPATAGPCGWRGDEIRSIRRRRVTPHDQASSTVLPRHTSSASQQVDAWEARAFRGGKQW